MALKPVLKLKVDELFLRWLSESDTQHMLKENLKHLVRSEPLSATYPVGSGSRSASKQASPRVRPSSPPLSSSKLPSPRSPRRPLTTKNSQRGHNGNTKLSEPTERVSVDSKSKAVAFLRLLKSKDILCFMFFLMDVLSPLRRLSLLLQERKCVVGRQHSEISTTLEIIRKFKEKDGPHLRRVADLDEFEGNRLTNCNVAEFQSARKTLLVEIETALEKRFADFSSPNVVLSTRIADIQTWPTTWEQLKDYGDDDLLVLLDHFKDTLEHHGVDVAEAELEWTALKKVLHDECLQKDKDCDWVDINKQRGEKFPNILNVMDLILSLSPSSSEAERGFSQLKLIKSNLRSRLGQSALNQCMAIKLLAPDIEAFDPLPAIYRWNSMGVRSRRPLFKDSVPKSVSKSVHTLELETPPATEESDLVDDLADEVEESDLVEEPVVEVVSAAEGWYKGDSDCDSGVDSDLDEDTVFSKLLDFDMRGM